MQQLVDATQISASWVWVSGLPSKERECLSQGQVLINITWFVCMSSCYLHIVIHFTCFEVGATPQLVTHFCTALDVYIISEQYSTLTTGDTHV